MEDRETARVCKYGESKTTRIMMANAPHVTSGLGIRKFQADGFLLTRVYKQERWYRNFITGKYKITAPLNHPDTPGGPPSLPHD
jgi:hypothetical protein